VLFYWNWQCANCENEAKLYCCWSTCYCSILCQKEHWEREHSSHCHHKQQNVSSTWLLNNAADWRSMYFCMSLVSGPRTGVGFLGRGQPALCPPARGSGDHCKLPQLIERAAYTQRDLRGGNTRRGQRSFPSKYYEDGHSRGVIRLLLEL